MSITATLTSLTTLTATVRHGPFTPSARPKAISLQGSRWVRLAQAFATSWADWRATAQRRRDERLVAALPRHVLCDVGLGHLAPDRLQLPWPEIERARW